MRAWEARTSQPRPRHSTARKLFVYEIAVLPPFRRRKVGTHLMGHVRNLVAEERLMEAFVLTDRDNAAAVRLYHGTGGQLESESGVLFVYPGHPA